MSDYLDPASSFAFFLLRHLRYLGASTEISEKCEICWEPYDEKLPVVQILNLSGCDHVFGRKCLGLWLQEHNTCPKCRLTLYSGLTPVEAIVMRENLQKAYRDSTSPPGDLVQTAGSVNPPTTNPIPATSLATHETRSQESQNGISPNGSSRHIVSSVNPQPITRAPQSSLPRQRNRLQVPQYATSPHGNLTHTASPFFPQFTNAVPPSVLPRRQIPNSNWYDAIDHVNPRSTNTADLFILPYHSVHDRSRYLLGHENVSGARFDQNRIHQADVSDLHGTQIGRRVQADTNDELRDIRFQQQRERQITLKERRDKEKSLTDQITEKEDEVTVSVTALGQIEAESPAPESSRDEDQIPKKAPTGRPKRTASWVGSVTRKLS